MCDGVGAEVSFSRGCVDFGGGDCEGCGGEVCDGVSSEGVLGGG